jgi:hypothetical protein
VPFKRNLQRYAEERSSLFEQASSRKPTLPRVNFSRAERDKQSRVFISNEHSRGEPLPLTKAPGPGEYKQKSSMFAQVDSRKDSMPNVVMSRAKRFDHERSEGSRVVGPLYKCGMELQKVSAIRYSMDKERTLTIQVEFSLPIA